jgi:hypothetical protein
MIDILNGRKFYPSRENLDVQLNAGPRVRLVKVASGPSVAVLRDWGVPQRPSRHGDL